MTVKKVLYLLPQPYLLSRGSSFRALATVDALAELGYQVDLLCYPIGKGPKKNAYKIFRSSSIPFLTKVKIGPSFGKCLFDIPFAWKAFSLVKKNKYDLIHGVEEAGLIASCLGRKYKIPYIYDMHSWMSQQIEDSKFIKSKIILNYFKKLELQAMNRAKAIITVGPEMTKLLTSLAPSVTAYSLLDCPLNFSELASVALKKTIQEKFFSQEDSVLVYTGNFHSYQGIDLLIESIAELKRITTSETKKFRLLLVGGGSGEEQVIDRYKKKVAALGLTDEIIFCGEFPAEAMPVFMELADLLVSSRVQGNNVPLKIYTYLASGNLLLATNIASHTQVLNSENCLLADPEPNSLARAIHRGLFEISEAEKKSLVQAALQIGSIEQQEKFKAVLKDCYKNVILN